jgi:hypothetical protein
MIDIIDNNLSIENLKCWKYSNEYEIFIFTKVFENEEELINNWETINESIAIEFQSTLESNVSIWNLYLILFVQGNVKLERKLEIEQDKYSTRKIVKDNFILDTEKEFIEEKLFNIDLGSQNREYIDDEISLKDELSVFKDLNSLLEEVVNED